jgi:RecA-family ATPase
MPTPARYGASPEDWMHFSVHLGLRGDLLPVVSDPTAVISPNSKMQDIGKTPSLLNRNNQVVGIPQWTGITATADDITRWSKEDYGICIQTRRSRAIDVDVLDREHADRIARRIDQLAPGLPKRLRSNSSKFLVVFECAGDLTKRKFKTDHGIVEFLAGGQQFIACGTHPSGARYEWAGGLPDDIPVLARERVEALWSALVADFAIEPDTETKGTERHLVLEASVSSDPTVAALDAAGLIQSRDRDGKLHITCPFADGHTDGESKGSSTTYFPAHTGGYERGHFSCLHASCAGRTDAEYLEVLGLIDDPADDFDIITAEVEAQEPAQVVTSWPGAIDLRELAFDEPEPPAFIIPDWLPEGMATLFAGHGGAGKSGIALHLSACISLGREYFGLQPKQRRVLYLSCEDRASMLHWRLHHVCKHMGVMLADLHEHLYLLDLVGKDSLLYNKDPRNGRYITPSFKAMRACIADYGAEVVVVDGISDTFAGNENSRGEVKQFVNMMVDAIPKTGALVLVGHVAKPAVLMGGKTPDGYSGSTGWHNAVRARWYLHPEQDDGDDVTKARHLVLALQKSNYGRTDQSLVFEWCQDSHLFVGARQEAATLQERIVEDEEEHKRVLRVIIDCNDRGVVVPAAMQGSATAFKFLRVNPGWPARLRADKKESRDRTRDCINLLVQQGMVKRTSALTDSRNVLMVFEATDEGRAWLNSDDLAMDEKEPDHE